LLQVHLAHARRRSDVTLLNLVIGGGCIHDRVILINIICMK
jgi:hypothetical protein